MWKNIKNWEQFYEVNEYGEVRNKLNGNIIKGDTNSSGYERVCLYNKNNNPEKQRFFRHRLVAENFIENIDNLPIINHIDNNIHNNYYKNLEFVSQDENVIHSYRYGNREIKSFYVKYNDGRIEFYEYSIDLAKEIGVSKKTVLNWLHNKSNSYIKYNINKIYYS